MKFVTWLAYHLESPAIIDDYIERIKGCLKGHEFVICRDLETIKREIVDADVMVGWRITPEVLAEARKLKWIQFGSAGIDHSIFPELLDSNIILTTLSGIHTVVVAEHVLAQMLALTRRLDLSIKLQLNHNFDRMELAATSDELAGKTLGIVGLGKIGLSIAKFAKAFDMQVVGTKRTIEHELPNVDEVYAADNLKTMLPQCDVLVLVVPLTSATHALLGREEIESMKNGAYLINVARGAMIDHDALGDALKSGKIRGAALDVFPVEPLPSDHPIYSLPNVIITPHTAGSSQRYGERAVEIFRHNLDAFLSSGEMRNVYDRVKGY